MNRNKTSTPTPSLFPTQQTLAEVATVARLCRVPVPTINALIDAGKVKVQMHVGKRMVCWEACQAALREGGGSQ